MSNISLRPLAEAILDQVTASKRESYACARESAFRIKRKILSAVDIYFGPATDPNLDHETARDIRNALSGISGDVYTVNDNLRTYEGYIGDTSTTEVPTVDEMVAELEQCQREMAEIRWNFEEMWISAITDKIVLQVPNAEGYEVDLGKFEIRLFYERDKSYDYRRENRKYNYEIHPLTPCYPLAERGINERHCHPHVKGTRLCEGDGTAVLTKALDDFRFCDFFVLINAILKQYNPDSPHFRLEGWDRVKCYECSGYMTEGELVQCSYCDRKMCTSCAQTKTCFICNKTICSRHTGQRKIRKCDRCDHYVCIQHYKSIRKHVCFKEIRKEREEKAKERLELIEQIKIHRQKIAENGITSYESEPTIENDDETTSAVQSVELLDGSVTANRRQYTTVTIPNEIAGQISVVERPDHRTPDDIVRDYVEGLPQEEVTGPAGWTN